MKIYIFALLITSSICRLSGFESNIEKVQTSTKIVFDHMNLHIDVIEVYMKNYEKFTKNEVLFSLNFLDDFNKMIIGLEDDRGLIFRNLKLMLKNIYYVSAREKSFDLFLKDDYSNLIQFLANLDLEENLEDLFKDFVGQKNMVFYDIKQLHENIKDITITILNYYYIFEKMRKDSKLEKDKNQKLSLNDLKRYYFVLGIIKNLRDEKTRLLEIEDSFEKNMRTFGESLASFDDALDTLKIFYHKRYVEGIVDDEEEESHEHESGEEEEDMIDDEDAKEDTRNPINLCDTIFLDNYDIDGKNDAEELERFDSIMECPNITNTCCTKNEISRVIKKFDYSVLPIIQKQYKAIYDMMNFILDNYDSLNKFAYNIYRLPKKDPICALSSKNVIFTPISKDFVTKFKEYMESAFKFSLNARNGMYCALCNYDFNKTMIEERTIKLSGEFCSKMIKDTFDFTSAYNLQLIDYFNNLVKVLQCDPVYGEERQETSIKFEENKPIIDILVKCDEKDRENCFEYCSNFYFTKFNSIFDVDFQLIYDFFKFLSSKVNSLKIHTDNNINHDSLRIIFADFTIEKNDKGLQSIDTLRRVIIEDEEDTTAHNPYVDGLPIKSVNKLFD